MLFHFLCCSLAHEIKFHVDGYVNHKNFSSFNFMDGAKIVIDITKEKETYGRTNYELKLFTSDEYDQTKYNYYIREKCNVSTPKVKFPFVLDNTSHHFEFTVPSGDTYIPYFVVCEFVYNPINVTMDFLNGNDKCDYRAVKARRIAMISIVLLAVCILILVSMFFIHKAPLFLVVSGFIVLFLAEVLLDYLNFSHECSEGEALFTDSSIVFYDMLFLTLIFAGIMLLTGGLGLSFSHLTLSDIAFVCLFSLIASLIMTYGLVFFSSIRFLVKFLAVVAVLSVGVYAEDLRDRFLADYTDENGTAKATTAIYSGILYLLVVFYVFDRLFMSLFNATEYVSSIYQSLFNLLSVILLTLITFSYGPKSMKSKQVNPVPLISQNAEV